jgi:hypothetical protein
LSAIPVNCENPFGVYGTFTFDQKSGVIKKNGNSIKIQNGLNSSLVSTISIALDCQNKLIQFGINGQTVDPEISLSDVNSIQESSLVFCFSIPAGDVFHANIGFHDFQKQLAGFISMKTFVEQQSVILPFVPEIFDSSNNQWRTVTNTDEIMDFVIPKIEDVFRRRCRVMSWIMFQRTLPRSDNFFHASIIEESPHPYFIFPVQERTPFEFHLIVYLKSMTQIFWHFHWIQKTRPL